MRYSIVRDRKRNRVDRRSKGVEWKRESKVKEGDKGELKKEGELERKRARERKKRKGN